MNEFAVETLRRVAHAVVQNGDVMQFSKAAQEAFARALINPPSPNAAMKRAFARGRQMFKKP